MRTTPASYYWNFVVPNLEDLRENPRDLRLAFNAAISAFHMSDVFFKYYERHDPARLSGRNRESFLKYLGVQERSFITVQTAATVYKHMYTYKHYLDGHSPASFGVVSKSEGEIVEGGWSDPFIDAVTVTAKDGIKRSLNEALEKVIHELWPKILGNDLKD